MAISQTYIHTYIHTYYTIIFRRCIFTLERLLSFEIGFQAQLVSWLPLVISAVTFLALLCLLAFLLSVLPSVVVLNYGIKGKSSRQQLKSLGSPNLVGVQVLVVLRAGPHLPNLRVEGKGCACLLFRRHTIPLILIKYHSRTRQVP